MFQHQDLFEQNKSYGFTLVEALVALAILTVGLVPVLWVSTSSVKLTGSISNSLIAAHLAQEGIEVVRAIRDTNWFMLQQWDTNLVSQCSSGCRVQWDTDVPVSGATVTMKLKIDPTTNMYQYDNGPDTIFSRVVTITLDGGGYKFFVTSKVDWMERGVPKSFTVESYLFDWLP